MYINAFTVRTVMLNAGTLWNTSFCRCWTLSTQCCIAYHYPYITHKGRKQIGFIQTLKNDFFGKKSIVCSFIQSRAWRVRYPEPQHSRLPVSSPLGYYIWCQGVCVLYFSSAVFLNPASSGLSGPTSQLNTPGRFGLVFNEYWKRTLLAFAKVFMEMTFDI